MRVRRSVMVATATSLLAVGLSACGNKTDETARAAGITPADALAFLSVSLDPSIEQKRNLMGIARRFPDAEVKDDFGEAKQDLLQQMLDDVGLDYEEDVEPWLGSELALAALPAGAGSGVPRMAVLIEQDDAAKARAALDKAIERMQSEDRPPVAYRVVGDFVVVVGSAPETSELLDVFEDEAEEDGGDLAAAEPFADVVDQLHGDRLVMGWIDGKEAFEALADVVGGGALPMQLPVESFQPVAFDLHAGGSSLVFEAVGRSTAKGKAGRPQLTEALPRGVLGALTVFDLLSGFEQAMQAAVGGGGDPLAEVEAELGIDIEGDVLSWIGGEALITMSPGEAGSRVPQFALVVEPTDRERAEAAVPRLADSAGRAMGAPLEQRQIGGATAYVAAPTGEGVQAAMALFEDRFVLASTPTYLEELSKGADQGLGESDAYQSVVGEASSDTTRAQLFVDIDAVRELVERMFLVEADAEGRAEYETEVKPNLEPLDAFGFVLKRDGDYERGEVKLTFD